MAALARDQAEIVRQFLQHRRLEDAPQEALDQVSHITGRWRKGNNWHTRMSTILRPYFTQGPWAISEALSPIDDRINAARSWLMGQGAPRQTPVRPILSDLHDRLIQLSGTLMTLPSPAPLPSMSPPAFARLREDVVAETVSENLVVLIDEGLSRHQACLAGMWPTNPGWPSPYRSTLSGRFQGSLPFLTTEVYVRYSEATEGFELLEKISDGVALRPDQFSVDYRAVVGDWHLPIYAAFITIAVNYLAEVLEHMPVYAEASGQGKRRDPVTIYGNVGAIHSQVSNSNISVADAVTNIGTTIQAVADRGETGAADAIRALAEAIQHDPGLTEDLRAQLLDHVADVADAAAVPDEPRRLSRARAAMAAIAAAAGTSSQLAQTVSTWQDVLGRLF
ncbi:hypothetical protein ACFXAO_15970 [Streptomyces lavendulae]|uniref:hypothetical protein n=1 Tax=Streptomyces lavendulae TaxID=1914 RepID=UPI0036992E39